MLNVAIKSITLSVFMLNVVILSVVAPGERVYESERGKNILREGVWERELREIGFEWLAMSRAIMRLMEPSDLTKTIFGAKMSAGIGHKTFCSVIYTAEE
jgi:hypothetical protein